MAAPAAPWDRFFIASLVFVRASPSSRRQRRGGSYLNVQPYLYWACLDNPLHRLASASGPGEGFEWNFSFGNRLQGTNLIGNALYVVMYYPENAPATSAYNPPSFQPFPHDE